MVGCLQTENDGPWNMSKNIYVTRTLLYLVLFRMIGQLLHIFTCMFMYVIRLTEEGHEAVRLARVRTLLH